MLEILLEERNLCWNTTDGGSHQHFGVPCSLHFINNIVYVREGPLIGGHVRNVGGVWANNEQSLV